MHGHAARCPRAGRRLWLGGSEAHAFCVDETNRYRQMNGKPVVAHSAQLEAYANTGAMVDHTGSPHQHFSSTSGGGIAFAENECPRWNSSSRAVAT